MKIRGRTDFIAIHCSATSEAQDIGRDDIDKWHRAKGWQMVGYHFIIRRDGTVQEGRELGVSGAHVEGYNSRSIGICMVGGVDTANRPRDNFTDMQWASLEALVRQMMAKYPKARVQGHRDFPAVHKACPSFSVADWMGRVGLMNPSPKE